MQLCMPRERRETNSMSEPDKKKQRQAPLHLKVKLVEEGEQALGARSRIDLSHAPTPPGQANSSR